MRLAARRKTAVPWEEKAREIDGERHTGRQHAEHSEK